MSRFEGKGVAVTGGASGIGEATVCRFVEEGARVAFADHDAERGRAVSRELESQGAAVHFVEAAMGDEAQVARLVETAAARPCPRHAGRRMRAPVGFADEAHPESARPG